MNGTLAHPTDRFARMIERSFPRDLFGLGDEPSTRAWTPLVDIRETPEALEVHADVPGLSKDDIHISLENNLLTLSGERRFDKETKQQDWHRVERSYGAFSRSFSLPNNVAAEKVTAAFKDGVLTINIPKAESARPRKIAIS